MKYAKFVVSCLFVLSILPAHAKQITVNEVTNIQQAAQSGEFTGRAQWNALTYYLQGVIEGAAGYQKNLKKPDNLDSFAHQKIRGILLKS